MTKPLLEIRIPGSPVPNFFNRIQLIIRSIRSLGEPFHDAFARVTFNPTADYWEKGAPFTRAQIGGLDEVCFISNDEMNTWANTNNKYAAAILERFRPPFNAEHVLMLDADVIAVENFSELFVHMFSSNPADDIDLQAVMAHVAPFDRAIPSWVSIFSLYDQHLELPEFDQTLTGHPFMTPSRFSLPYFNTGMVLAKASALEAMADNWEKAVACVRGAMDSYFIDQIALTLAMLKTGLSYKCLPVQYNFPNDPAFDHHYPDELKQAKFIHFLREGVIHRVRDFQDMKAMKHFTERSDLTGSNEIFRKRVAGLLVHMETGGVV